MRDYGQVAERAYEAEWRRPPNARWTAAAQAVLDASRVVKRVRWNGDEFPVLAEHGDEYAIVHPTAGIIAARKLQCTPIDEPEAEAPKPVGDDVEAAVNAHKHTDDCWTAAAQAAIDAHEADRVERWVRWNTERCKVLAENNGDTLWVLDGTQYRTVRKPDCIPIDDEPEAEAPKPAGDDVDGLVKLVAEKFLEAPLGEGWRAAVIAIRDTVLAGQKVERREVVWGVHRCKVLAEDGVLLWVHNGYRHMTVDRAECKPVRRFRHGDPVWYRNRRGLFWVYRSDDLADVALLDGIQMVNESELTPREVSDD
jgi:hypothetical protein